MIVIVLELMVLNLLYLKLKVNLNRLYLKLKVNLNRLYLKLKFNLVRCLLMLPSVFWIATGVHCYNEIYSVFIKKKLVIIFQDILRTTTPPHPVTTKPVAALVKLKN